MDVFAMENVRTFRLISPKFTLLLLQQDSGFEAVTDTYSEPNSKNQCQNSPQNSENQCQSIPSKPKV